jgi:hypothetical protein
VVDDSQALGLGLDPALGHLGVGLHLAQGRGDEPLDVVVAVADVGQDPGEDVGVVDQGDQAQPVLEGEGVVVDQTAGLRRQLEQLEPVPHVAGRAADAAGEVLLGHPELDQAGHGQRRLTGGMLLF